jgi:hypothetical protein
MATFHIGNQSGNIQNAEVIHNQGGVPPGLARTLEDLLQELRGRVGEGGPAAEPAAGAAAELVGALEEASSPGARPGRIRAGLERAAGLLAGVATAAGMVTSLEAIAAGLPLN